MRIGIIRPPWLLFVAVAFSIYLTLLLANAYQSQAQLRSAAEARLMVDSRQVASLITDFLDARRAFAQDLAESHAIDTFLINEALGMSMQYGLGASLYAIEESFREQLARQKVLGRPVYSDILYFDADGALIARAESSAPVIQPPLEISDGAKLVVDPDAGRIVAAAPVAYRGNPAGTVVTVTDLSLLSRFLTSFAAEVGFRQFLISEHGQPLDGSGRSLLDERFWPALAELTPDSITALESISVLRSASTARVYDLALKTPVAGTSLFLVTLLPEFVLYGHITSKGFLYFASITPIVLVLIALWIDRMRRRTRALEADVIESNRDREALQGRNDALLEEIARREALERKVRESEERYRTYVEHAPEGIFVADASGHFIDANPSACAMVGYARSELLAMHVTALAPRGRMNEHRALLARAREIGRQEVEVGLLRKDGAEIVTNLRVIALPGDIVMGYCVDITERKRAEEQIHSLAYFDLLTGLPNRRLLLDRLRQAMAGSRRRGEYGALLMLDLDHFKDLNDTQGHDVGDHLLVEVARRLTSCLRREDTVSRFGGDEYVVLAERLGDDEAAAARQAEQIAQKVHEALSQPYALADRRATHNHSASIGLALFRGEDVPVDSLLKQADVALYQAKSAGRGTVRFFNPEMQAAIEARARMEGALRRAIEGQELKVYFQPQVGRDGVVTGAEALLRWQPEGGELVAPDRFIRLAEDTGLIVPIGMWVLGQACEQLQRWQSHPRTRQLKLSINVSAWQFYQPDFVDQVTATVRASGIDPSRLTLELTESVVLDRVEEVIDRMQALKGIGIGFSLDDFGTGYSSLFCVKHLPLDQVKIDQTFVRDITHDPNDAAIVRAILAMGHSLGLAVVAEGVETEAQRALLHRFGCEGYQGYLFGRPVPIELLAVDRWSRVAEDATIEAPIPCEAK